MRFSLAALLCLAFCRSAAARADVIMLLRGGGMSDATSVAPVGGNSGTTLGEQRKLALEYAAQLWGERLDSSVPIHVDVVFDALPCSADTSVLGAAAAVALFSGISSNGANPGHFYASALANQLAGEDLDPAAPEITMQLNSDLDGRCLRASGGFYYGFDGQRGPAIDFVETVLHELAHGLGLASFADPERGTLLMGTKVDPFTARVRDLEYGRTWPALSDAERRTSAGHVRRVVWDGTAAQRSAAETFAAGVPSLQLSPAPAAMSGTVADTSFGQNPALQPASGDVVSLGDEACAALDPAAISGKIALLPNTARCPAAAAARAAQAAGAAGALVQVGSPFRSPALPFDGVAASVALPMLSVSVPDARRIGEALGGGALHATLAGQPRQARGTDAEGRPLLFASDPVSSGSSISHLDPLVRPQELMEPITGPVPTHELSFTLAMLADLGWHSSSDAGVRDAGEVCQNGCAPDCLERCPRCGDGAKDPGEECDDGARNADGAACRKDCTRARCGDGVVDRAEACDDGRENSDTEPDACRRDCQIARCGDGVRDADEECDDGRRNSNSRADACRSDCRRARCGDGVRDAAEECDGERACSECHELGRMISSQQPAGEVPDAGSFAETDAGAEQRVRAEGCGCEMVRSTPQSQLASLLIALFCTVRLLKRVRSGPADRRRAEQRKPI